MAEEHFHHPGPAASWPWTQRWTKFGMSFLRVEELHLHLPSLPSQTLGCLQCRRFQALEDASPRPAKLTAPVSFPNKGC